ncbi:Pyridine nucleotide-disulphide oxidoreductase [Geodermatophilus amargosae]|uniref:Pyridine nucleotide-disulphide oxidoreductase n=1 Tax=Geodermatophilus amargosae TaxID=1296565 RepID=A0A1I7CVK4_9ACTN|nr:NAD(P)-binding protein [Geodermatophilus amargosae]SFU03495.1 Pyridine nucleotide-disulphide oxidoreductase [Geodermatophilus amargosae]
MREYDVIVVGAGQAGLAAGHALRTTGLSFTLLEGGEQPGGSWPRFSRVAAVRPHQVFPRSAITSAEAVSDGLAAARGLRAPGLAIPGRRKIGTWRGRGARRFVDVRRGQPALRLRLQGQHYDELLIGHDDAAALAARLAPVN